MTPERLSAAVGCSIHRAAIWAEPLSFAMAEHAIDTAERQAAFLAQIGHESGRLQYVKELWGPTPVQVRYEGRTDLGNTEPGDGFRFRGRGLIQITGRANYRAVGQALGEDLEERPELLEAPIYAAMSAAWFWQSHGLNELADAAFFDKITKIINGGFNGHAERAALWQKAREALA
jgi:putative chitinase